MEPTASFDCPSLSFKERNSKSDTAGQPYLHARGTILHHPLRRQHDIGSTGSQLHVGPPQRRHHPVALLRRSHLIRKLIVADDATEIGWWKMVMIMAGGVCGALAYTWSDTFVLGRRR